MVQAIIQTSFNSGEWSPNLNARVDLKQYRSGAALLQNFFVDYRGGATASPGTKYIQQALADKVRLIGFQASFTVSYILEFGGGYVRFYNNGSPVLEGAKAITGISQANPGVVQSNAHGFANGNWVYATGVVGMTQVNSRYFIVGGVTANTFTLSDLNGTAVNTTLYSAYVSGGTVSRVYTLASPYQAYELAAIKFAQNVNTMVLCHPNYPPYQLVLTSAANWTLSAITFGSTVAAPTGQAVATTLAGGTWNYAYVITAVDAYGQESGPSAFAVLANRTDMRTVAGTNTVTWGAVTGAASYNVYKAILRDGTAVPAGAQFGFAGNCTSVTFIDSNIGPDFSQCAPVAVNPFAGTGIQSVTVTAPGTYAGLNVPTISFTGGAPGTGAIATAVVQATVVAINAAGANYSVFDTITITNGVVLQVASTNGFSGAITAVTVVNPGSISSGPVPANPSGIISTSGIGVGATFDITWGVTSVGVTSPGTGYTPTPAVVFSTGAATATAALGAPSSGNPTVPSYFQQRLVLAGPVSNPQQFNMSRPGAYYNFNVSNPLQPDDAFQGTLVSGQLNTIQGLISQPQGLVTLSDQSAWLINGGSAGSGVDATNTVSNAQVFSGAASLPPIVATDDILYVQSKGSIVRDLVFNYNKQVYTGQDISVMSSHLFYGYQLLEWAWAEEPFKIVWAVRNDGIMLSLTFLKEQELIAWTHRTTQGAFKSVATVTEAGPVGNINAVYVAVQRTINGHTVQYIERMVEQYYPNGLTDAWQVDAGLQYNGASALSFTGALHLAGATIVGLATTNTGIVSNFTAVVSAAGGFTIAAPTAPATGYTRVTAGLAYTPALQTLELDIGDPTIQGKEKKIAGPVTLKVANTLGLRLGTNASNTVPMKDLIIGNVGSCTNELVTDLVTGDVQTIINPDWSVPGQYYITQPFPYPATILGVIPRFTYGVDKGQRS
jgi:hypothetical protein